MPFPAYEQPLRVESPIYEVIGEPSPSDQQRQQQQQHQQRQRRHYYTNISNAEPRPPSSHERPQNTISARLATELSSREARLAREPPPFPYPFERGEPLLPSSAARPKSYARNHANGALNGVESRHINFIASGRDATHNDGASRPQLDRRNDDDLDESEWSSSSSSPESLDEEMRVMRKLHHAAQTTKSRIPAFRDRGGGNGGNDGERGAAAAATVSQTRIGRRRSKFLRIATVAVFLIFNLATFVALLRFRTFPEPARTVAKNSAILTLVNVSILVLTINRTDSEKTTVMQIVHRWSGVMLVLFSFVHGAAHVFLLYDLTHFLVDGIAYYYLHVFPLEYTSGVIILLALTVLVSLARVGVRKHRYNLFYFSHIIGWTTFAVFAGFHSYYLLLPVVATIGNLYAPRALVRWFVRPCLLLSHIGKQFVVIKLRVKNTWLARALILNRLRRDSGNALIWISASPLPGCSRFERHPYSVIETSNDEPTHSEVILMISSSGDWKSAFHSKIRKHHSDELYNFGMRVTIDSIRRANFLDREFVDSTRILFLLENVGIASFLGFLRFLCEPTNRSKLHDRRRTLELHYRIDDPDYLIFLDRYLEMVRPFKFLTVVYKIYAVTPLMFRGESAIIASRINHRTIVSDFLAGPGKHYIYTNDAQMHDKVERELERVRKSRDAKPSRAMVSL